MLSTRSPGSSRGSTSSRKVRRGSSALDHDLGLELGPVGERDAGRPAVAGEHRLDRRLQPDVRPVRLRGPRQHLGEAPVAALVERPGAEVPVVLPHRVVEQHQPGALRHRAHPGPDDAGRGDVALEDVALEVVVEEVRRAAGEHPDEVVHDLRLHTAEVRDQLGGRLQVLRRLAEDVRRHLVQQRLDRLHDAVHVVLVTVHRVRVVRRVPHDLLDVLVPVLTEQQVVAVLHRGERGRHQDRQEAVLDQLELVDDVRPQQAERVRERGEVEARDQLLGDRRATDQVPALEDQRLESRLGEVGAVDEAVVPAADDDRVVLRAGSCHGSHAVFRSGLNRGSRATSAPTVRYSWLMVSSTSTREPTAERSGRTRAIAMCRCSTGEYIRLVA